MGSFIHIPVQCLFVYFSVVLSFKDIMSLIALLGISILSVANSQLVDNFSCPDEFEGYYPHLYSCDKYWKCIDGRASLETCGNGLAFDDTDPTFTTENCNEIYNVECG